MRVFPYQVFPQLPLEQPRYEEREGGRLSIQKDHSSLRHQAPHTLYSQQGYQHNESQQNNQTIHQNYPNQQIVERRGKLNRASETRDGMRVETRGGKQGQEDDRERARREREEWERLEWERAEKERAERSRIERERAEREKTERIERERIERERAERERVERERMESERKEKERVERQRVEREIEEHERVERVRAAREREERIMMEQMEEERAERQRVERQTRENLGPRPSPLGEDSPPVGKAHTFGLHKVSYILAMYSMSSSPLLIAGAQLAPTSGRGGKDGNCTKKGRLR